MLKFLGDEVIMLIVCIILGVLVFLLALNSFPLCYREPQDEPVIKHKPFHPDCEPIEEDRGSCRAILFVHGYCSSPATYIYAAEEARVAGYDTYAPLLPGFGTHPEDLEATHYSQWMNYLRRYYLDLRDRYKELYIVGTSMGGLMAMDLAEAYSNTPQAPDAIALFAAPAYLNNLRLGIMTQPLAYITRSLGWFVKSLSPRIISDLKPQVYEDGSHRWKGYGGRYPMPTYTLLMAIRRVRKNLEAITVPTVLFHAPKDATVPFSCMDYIATHISSNTVRAHQVPLDKTHSMHLLLIYDSTREGVMQRLLDFFAETRAARVTIKRASDAQNPASKNAQKDASSALQKLSMARAVGKIANPAHAHKTPKHRRQRA